MGLTERKRWHGKVVSYPGDILVGPGRFHEGPDFIQIEKGGRYRWEYVELAEAASGAGRWSLVGPLKARKDFRNHDASSNGDKGAGGAGGVACQMNLF